MMMSRRQQLVVSLTVTVTVVIVAMPWLGLVGSWPLVALYLMSIALAGLMWVLVVMVRDDDRATERYRRSVHAKESRENAPTHP